VLEATPIGSGPYTHPGANGGLRDRRQ
jgi:hypothetical protein